MNVANKLEVIGSDDPRLYLPAAQLTIEQIKSKEVQELIDEMLNLMHSKGAVGVAANQLGVDMSIAVYGYKYRSELPQHPEIKDTVIINPLIKPTTGVIEMAHEGCLSIPNLRGLVPRYRDIYCRYIDRNGARNKKQFHGLEARIVQHEHDHLAGILFLARVDDFSTLQFLDK